MIQTSLSRPTHLDRLTKTKQIKTEKQIWIEKILPMVWKGFHTSPFKFNMQVMPSETLDFQNFPGLHAVDPFKADCPFPPLHTAN
jgi:hypothetical protein